MDNIRKLRNLLEKCDNTIDFKQYDTHIESFYNNDFLSLISKYKNNKTIIIKHKLKKNDYDTYYSYFSKISKIEEDCLWIINNKVSIKNLNLDKSILKDGKLNLEDENNLDYILDILKNLKFEVNTRDEKNKVIYTDYNKKNPFAILDPRTVKSINVKDVSIKKKYYKTEEKAIIKDILKLYSNYYLETEDLDVILAYIDKKKAKRQVIKKKNITFLVFTLKSVLPGVILLGVFFYALFKVPLIPYPSIDFSTFSVKPFIYYFIVFFAFVAGIGLETFIARSLLYRLPIFRGVGSYWTSMISYALIFAYFIYDSYDMGFDYVAIIMGFLVTLSAIFYGFLAGPKATDGFSLIGRMLITLTVLEFYIISYHSIPLVGQIVVGVLIIFGAVLGYGQKRVDGSEWY